MQNEYLYLADGRFGGMRVLKRNETGFENLHSVRTASYCDDLIVHGDILLNQNRELGVILYDLTDPAQPEQIGQVWRTDDAAIDIAVRDQWLLVLYSIGGLALYNIADPSRPQLIDHHRIGKRAQTLHWQGQNAFVADRDTGIAAYKIKLPE